MKMTFLKKFIIGTILFLSLAAGVVYVFDPFYHYHDAWGPLKRVLEEKEYQVSGTLANFDYDAILLGTSVAENNNNQWYDEAFDCTVVKGIRASGSNADLVEFLNRAYAHGPLKKVFYSLGLEVLDKEMEVTFPSEDYYYLMNRNPFDDIKYLWNKDILFKKIPVQIAYSLSEEYDEGESYNWYKTKIFSEEEILSRYYPVEEIAPALDKEAKDEPVLKNLDLLASRIEAHPETEYYLFIPPNSILWWDNEYREGRLCQELHKIELIVERLSGYENVKLFGFYGEEDIVTNLDYYMDTVHFSPEINRLIVNRMKLGKNLLTSENVISANEKMERMVKEFSEKGILEYYPEANAGL